MRYATRWLPAAVLFIAVSARGQTVLPPVPSPLQSYDVGTLHVDRFGKGEHALVLIPGLAGGPWVWSGIIARLSPNYSLYVVTLPGFDGRATVKEESLFAAFRRDFWEMLKTRRIEGPVVLGHSLGGTLAIALGEEHPERLSGIITADGMPLYTCFADMTAAQRKTAAKKLAGTLETLTKDSLLTSMKRYMRRFGANKPEMIEPAARLMARSDPQAMAAWVQEYTTVDLRPNLGKLTAPLLVIVPYDLSEAKQSGLTTAKDKVDFYTEFLAGTPQVKVASITPSLHFMMLDQPEAFEKTVSEFLSSVHW
jgi:pimeloyl-ACP methyl ester carboxylesterase